MDGSCVQSELVSKTDDCIFGDDIVVNQLVIADQLPENQMSCQRVLDYLNRTLNKDPYLYCSNLNFRKTCCKTCRSM